MKRVHVAAAVIVRPDGQFLLGQRAPDTFYPGYWEFPGGKVEAGETPFAALQRELAEELGIAIDGAWPWLTREHVYEHAHVLLHFFEVRAWRGEIYARVHSALAWQAPSAVSLAPMLPANAPILKALGLPRRIGITHAAAIGVATQLESLDRALAAGLAMVHIREAALAAPEREAFAHQVVARCHAVGALAVVNGDLELARRVGADGVHLPATQLAALEARPDFAWVGASCHSRAELDRAAALALDYAALGTVCPSATHPDLPALDWDGFRRLAAGLSIPVFALGGLGRRDMETARASGAHGIAAIRDSWSEPPPTPISFAAP